LQGRAQHQQPSSSNNLQQKNQAKHWVHDILGIKR
jgi:hypothetical protein